jgi:metallo-beta-lactamase family protein
MCTGGRIIHHLKQNVWRRECHVVIVGYQAYGTLGRRLVNGEETVRIHGETLQVRSRIHTVGGLSAHADQNDLLRWVGGFKSQPSVFVVHGEPETRVNFSRLLGERLQLQATVPQPGEVVDLAAIGTV